MSSPAIHPAVAELLESRRLGSLAASRQRFTVSREQALLRLREQARERDEGRYEWTLLVVRAAHALSELAEARVELAEAPAELGEELQRVVIDVVTPGIELDALDLSDMLAGALEPDLGQPLEEVEPELRMARFRMLIGRAINAALAREPVAVELSTPSGGRRFERREQLVEGRDPYIEAKVPRLEGHSRFVVSIVEPRPGLSSRLGRWLRRQGELGEELARLWRSRRLADHEAEGVGEDGALSLAPALSREPVRLGEHALFGPTAGHEGVPAPLSSTTMLARDGVLLADLGPALRAHGRASRLDLGALSGWIDCPRLRLSADERGVVRDANFELLLAWLHDYAHRAHAAEPGRVAWPESLAEGVRAASGRSIPIEELAEDTRRRRELVFVWQHQAEQVPPHVKAKIAALWPSEALLVRERFPELRLVPLRALGDQGQVDPADLTSLAIGSYEPLALVKDSPIAGDESGDSGEALGGLRLSVDAYVHRAPTASTGFIVILAYERRVAQIHERAKVFPGVTLVCRVRAEGAELELAALRRDHLALDKIAELCRGRTRQHWEALLAHVMSRANAWENPLLRTSLDELGPATIDLRYRQTEDGVRLGWRDTVLLDTVVGRTRAGEARTLRDALGLLRQPGFILVGHPLKRYEQIRSDDPRLQPWLVDDAARALIERVVGRAAVLDMPVVAEAHPLVVEDPVEDQRHLVRGRATVERELERKGADPLARLRLLGHLLVVRGLQQAGGGDSFGLESVPLLDRYDPRAMSPTRLVSLASVLSERPRPGLVPAGAVHRGLPRPMLEVVPGLAALLGEVEELEPGTSASGALSVTVDAPPSERSSTTPVRRRSRGVPPLLAKAVVHPLVIGRLQVAGDGSSEGIGLWDNGLRVGELELPEPLGRVSGRLLLTPSARRVGKKQVREQVIAEARALLADALRQRALLPPEGPQRRRLDHFVDYVRSVIRVEDRFELGDDFGLGEPEDRGRRVALLRQMSLKAAPLRPLGRRREALLAEIVRQSLAMRVAFDTAMLSWKPVKLGRRRDGAFEIEFGLRNGWIQRGLDEGRELDEEGHRRAGFLAGVFVVGGVFEQGREWEEVEMGGEHLVVAMWRLLKLAGA